MNRNPAVAGQFYSAGKEQLKKSIAACFHHPHGPGAVVREGKGGKSLVAAVVPHAGYIYSGMVAAHVYKRVASSPPPPEVFIILGPNHWGRGEEVALYPEGTWSTPLGEVKIDISLAERLLDDSLIQADTKSHISEHSIEVQLPFLQTVLKDFTFVPISLIDQSLATAKALGQIIAKAIKEDTRRIMILASSDFSHYVSAAKAQKDDSLAIEQISALNVDGFYELLVNKEISVCGFGPIMAAMTAVSLLGVKQGQLLKYATSGDVQSMTQVVGYAAIVFEK